MKKYRILTPIFLFLFQFTLGSFLVAQPSSLDFVYIEGLLVSRTEIPQSVWKEIMGSDPSFFKGEYLPVESISWYEAIEFCNRLSLDQKLPVAYRIFRSEQDPENQNPKDLLKWRVEQIPESVGFRLPTNAEWELFAKVDQFEHVFKVWESRQSSTRPVGGNTVNRWGLYDLGTNVSEWCWDWFDDKNIHRVFRGGNWSFTTNEPGVLLRSNSNPSSRYRFLGVRVVRNF